MDSLTPHRLISGPRMVDVVGWMKRFAHGPQGKESLDVRGLVEDIVRDVEPGDYAGEALACYYWVCRNIKYRRDITGVEFVKSPLKTLQTKQGDCDDIATLLAAMLMSIGNRCRFVLVGFKPGGPPTHVFCAVVMPDGSAIPLDPVANRVTAPMMRGTAARKVIEVGDVDDSDEDDDFVEPDVGYEDGGRGGDPAAGDRVERTFSVWDYPKKQFAYYVATTRPTPPTGGFRRPRRTGNPEGLAALLPAGARKVGGGPRAKGTIATLGGIGDGVGAILARVQPKDVALAVGAAAVFGGLAWALARPSAKVRRARARRALAS